MTKKILLYFLFSLVSTVSCWAQIGGTYAFNFLDYKFSARLAGLGGSLIAVHDNDPTLIMYNPSTISPRFNTALSINAAEYFTQAGYLSTTYSQTFKKVGSFAAEVRYVNYGNFYRTNEAGYEQGTFSANEGAFTLGWGRQLDSSFSIGANLKMMFCGYDSYSSFGMAVDVAGSYYNAKKNISFALLVKNMGGELKPLVEGKHRSAPFDIQLAFSQRFKFMPVRYHISLHSLYKWKMGYVGPNDPALEIDAITGEPKYPSKFKQGMNNFFRHINFGLEIIPVKYLTLFVSYNHNQNREMRIPQKKSMAGFGYGFLIDIKSIQFGFSRSQYAVGAAPNYFSFSLNINDLTKLTKSKKQNKLDKVSAKEFLK